MSLTAHVIAVARMVKAATRVLALTVMVTIVAVQVFASQRELRVSTTTPDATAFDDQLSVAVTAQEMAGRRCTTTPSLTDVILFQDAVTQEVRVLSFDGAAAAAAARSGWVRRYCVERERAEPRP